MPGITLPHTTVFGERGWGADAEARGAVAVHSGQTSRADGLATIMAATSSPGRQSDSGTSARAEHHCSQILKLPSPIQLSGPLVQNCTTTAESSKI